MSYDRPPYWYPGFDRLKLIGTGAFAGLLLVLIIALPGSETLTSETPDTVAVVSPMPDGETTPGKSPDSVSGTPTPADDATSTEEEEATSGAEEQDFDIGEGTAEGADPPPSETGEDDGATPGEGVSGVEAPGADEATDSKDSEAGEEGSTPAEGEESASDEQATDAEDSVDETGEGDTASDEEAADEESASDEAADNEDSEAGEEGSTPAEGEEPATGEEVTDTGDATDESGEGDTASEEEAAGEESTDDEAAAGDDTEIGEESSTPAEGGEPAAGDDATDVEDAADESGEGDTASEEEAADEESTDDEATAGDDTETGEKSSTPAEGEEPATGEEVTDTEDATDETGEGEGAGDDTEAGEDDSAAEGTAPSEEGLTPGAKPGDSDKPDTGDETTTSDGDTTSEADAEEQQTPSTGVEVAITEEDDTNTITGKDPPGTHVILQQDGVVVGKTTTDEDGSWSLPLLEVVTPDATVQVVVEGKDGTVLSTTDVSGMVKEATQDVVAANRLTTILNNRRPTFSGNTVPGAIVRLFDGNRRIAQKKAGKQGNWYIAVSYPLTVGNHTLRLAVISDGKRIATQTFEVTIPAGAPAIRPPRIVRPRYGLAFPGKVIRGTAPKDSTLGIYIDRVLVDTVLTNRKGRWQYEFDNMPDGNYILRVAILDEQGNVLSESRAVKIEFDAGDPPYLLPITGSAS